MCNETLPLPANWLTLGPSSLDNLRRLIAAGTNGVRLTFSFGTPDLQASRAVAVKEAARSAGKSCATIADLPGGKPRLGRFTGADVYDVVSGQHVALVLRPSADPASGVLPVDSRELLESLIPGDLVLVGDGACCLRIVTATQESVVAEIIESGRIEQTRGLITRGSQFDPASLTEKDRRDLAFIEQTDAFDAVAISFVSSASEIIETRRLLGRSATPVSVIAKIEHPRGVAAADEISKHADAVIIGRGDLALALDWVELPAAVSTIAEACKANDTPYIIGTQVAEGLERFVFPTRAEICDLAHWLSTGAAGALLSYETAFGSNPLGAVGAIQRLIERWYDGGGL